MTPDQVLVVPDTTVDSRFAGNPMVLDDPELRFYAGAPLLDADGLPLGALCVLDDRPRDAFTPAQTAQLSALGQEIIAILVDHAVIPVEGEASGSKIA
jgi:GAF domain-containing protein